MKLIPFLSLFYHVRTERILPRIASMIFIFDAVYCIRFLINILIYIDDESPDVASIVVFNTIWRKEEDNMTILDGWMDGPR